MTPYKCYRAYIALKVHFTSLSYNVFQNNGHLPSTTTENFLKRKDKLNFERLSRHKDPLNYMVANFVDGRVMWTGDMFTDSSDDIYKNWNRRIQSLTYNYKTEISQMAGQFKPFIQVTDGQFPKLLRYMQQKKLSPETVVILNHFIDFIPMWDQKISDDLIYPSYSLFIKKYKYFVNFDEQKCRKLLKDCVLADK